MKAKRICILLLTEIFLLMSILGVFLVTEKSFAETTQKPEIPETNVNLYDAVAGEIPGAMSGGARKAIVAEDGSIRPLSADEEDYYNISTVLNRDKEFWVKKSSEKYEKVNKNKLAVYTKVKIKIDSFCSTGLEQWHGVGLVVKRGSEQATRIRLFDHFKQVLVQQTMDGKGEDWQGSEDRFFDSGDTQSLQVGAEITLEVLTGIDTMSVWVNDFLAIDNINITSKGDPAFSPYFINMGVTMSNIEQKFVEDVDLDYKEETEVIQIPEGNPNILHTEGYETVVGNRIIGNEGANVKLENGVVSIDRAAFNGAYSLTNDLFQKDKFDVLTADGKVPTPVEDLTLFTEAKLNFGAYNSAEPWEGLGIIFGITKDSTKCYKIRLTKDGTAYLFERTITEPQSERELARATFTGDVSEGSSAKVEILNEQGKVSVWVNENKVFDNFDIGCKVRPYFGAEFAQNAGSISDFVMTFTQPVSVEIPDEEIVIPEANPDILHFEGCKTVIGYRVSGGEGANVKLENGVFSIDNSAFNGAYSLTNNLFQKDKFDVLTLDGKVPTPVEDLTLFTEAKLNFGAYNSAETWEGLGIIFGITKDGTKCYKIRLTKDGTAYLFERTITEPQSERELARATFTGDVSEGSSAKVEILNEQGKVSVWVNGNKVFRSFDIGGKVNPFFGAEFAQNAGSVSDFYMSFVEPVLIDISDSGEEKYPPEPEKPPVNDIIIEPETNENSGLGFIIVGSIFCALAIGIAVVFFVVYIKSNKRRN